MNIVILSGRLTADPDIRMGTNDTKIARYILAVERRVKRIQKENQTLLLAYVLEKMQNSQRNILKKARK